MRWQVWAAGAVAAAAVVSCGVGEDEQAGDLTPINGCDPTSAVDATGASEVVIRFGDLDGYQYDPSCVRVRVGTTVRFTGDFVTHPLGIGRVEPGMPPPDPSHPFREMREGESASFRVSERGSFGFFCNVHLGERMMGAVFVESAERS